MAELPQYTLNSGTRCESPQARRDMNHTVRRFAILLALIPTIALAAWRQDSQSHTGMAMAGAAWSDLMASMQKMDVDMAAVQPSGNDDFDFVRLMLPHHQAAIDMAKAQLL